MHEYIELIEQGNTERGRETQRVTNIHMKKKQITIPTIETKLN